MIASALYVNGWGKLQVELALEIFLRHCLLLVLRRSSLFFAARHNDRAGGDRAAGVSDERSERRAAPEHVGDSGPVEVEGFMFSVLRLYILRGVLVSVLV